MHSISNNREFPVGYAERLLNCEIKYKLSNTPTLELVNTLIDVYKTGLQFCQSIRSYKQLYFKLKINEVFMSNASILQKPVEASVQTVNKPQTSINRKKAMSTTSDLINDPKDLDKIRHTKQIINNAKQSATRLTVKKIINDSKIKNIQNKEKVLKQLAFQDQVLAQKLEKRSRRSSGKVFFGKSQSTVDVSDFSKQEICDQILKGEQQSKKSIDKDIKEGDSIEAQIQKQQNIQSCEHQ